MSKLGLLRTSIMSSLSVRTAMAQNRGLTSLLREPVRRFSTEAENPLQDSSTSNQPLESSPSDKPQKSSPSDKPQESSPSESFFETPSTGSVYGRLLGVKRNTLKTDVVNLLEGCNLIAVCCPGLLHSGVLFENSDFGLEREVGPDENYRRLDSSPAAKPQTEPSSSQIGANHEVGASGPNCSWSLFDDLYFDTVYDDSEAQVEAAEDQASVEKGGVRVGGEFSICKKRKVCRSMRSHSASGVWNLSREQGNKLLHSRFRGDCLYICDWPFCVHIEEKRNYMLFRGIFKDFKGSQVWRTIRDGNRSKIDLNCAFCSCKETWDLHSAFCLRRVFGYHDDGEPVVRAYVCENGHVSGAWTDLPLYS